MTYLLIWLIGVVFGAGICYAQIRRMSADIRLKAELKDVNNIGHKLNRTADEAARRARNIEFALLSVCDPKRRAEIAAMLKGN